MASYNPYGKWEQRNMPSPVKLMRLVNGTGTDAQEMYYSMMGMKKTDFDVANAAVQAMTDLRKGGMDPYMLEGIDNVCKAITSKDIEGMNAGIKRISDVLAMFCNKLEKASEEDDDEKDDKEPEEKKGDDKEDAPKDEDAPEGKDAPDIPEGDKEPEVDISVEEAPEELPDAPVEAAEMPIEAPTAPAVDMRALMAGPQMQQVAAIDPALVLKALQMLQSIGQMC